MNSDSAVFEPVYLGMDEMEYLCIDTELSNQTYGVSSI